MELNEEYHDFINEMEFIIWREITQRHTCTPKEIKEDW